MSSSDSNLSNVIVPFPRTMSLASSETPPEVKELSKACVQYVERKLKFQLDSSAETLPVLDHYITLARDDLKGRLGEIELLLAVAVPAGAYLGEVVQKLFPLHWFCPPGEYQRWRLEFEHVFLSMNPIGMVVEALKLSDDENWGASFRLMPDDEALAKSTLQALPEVSIEEYFALSNRVEVLHTIVDVIWNTHTQKSKVPKVWGPEDYSLVRAEAIDESL